jgi:hypothetical protein
LFAHDVEIDKISLQCASLEEKDRRRAVAPV